MSRYVMFTYFHLMKDRATLFYPKTIHSSDSHLVVFTCKLFIGPWKDVLQDTFSHLKF